LKCKNFEWLQPRLQNVKNVIIFAHVILLKILNYVLSVEINIEIIRIENQCLFFNKSDFFLDLLFLGWVLNIYPQQGHHSPSHFMKISQIWHRFWLFEYLFLPLLFALWKRQISLQAILFTMNMSLYFHNIFTTITNCSDFQTTFCT